MSFIVIKDKIFLGKGAKFGKFIMILFLIDYSELSNQRRICLNHDFRILGIGRSSNQHQMRLVNMLNQEIYAKYEVLSDILHDTM